MTFRHLRLLLTFALAQSTSFAADRGPVLPASQKVADATQSEWSRAWWQWALSFDRRDSPVADATGEHCAAGQRGAVWFLAGTYGTHRTVRACTVPAGKYLFFPLVNVVQAPREGGGVDCADVIDAAAQYIADATNLVLRVDGIARGGLEAHRVSSDGCFDLGAGNRLGRARFPAAADGYYVMLAPLPPGRHTLDFGGVVPGMDMVQAVSYTLEVR